MKKTRKILESVEAHDNYEQTNHIQLELFHAENTPANQIIKYHTYICLSRV